MDKRILVVGFVVAIVSILAVFLYFGGFPSIFGSKYVQVSNLKLGYNSRQDVSLSFAAKNLHEKFTELVGIEIDEKRYGPFNLSVAPGQTGDVSYTIPSLKLSNPKTYQISLTFTMADGKFETYSGTFITTENLSVTSIVLRDVFQDLYELVLKNTGIADAKLEYLVINGAIIQSGIANATVPHNSQVTIRIPLAIALYPPGSTVEIRLHTVSGHDFTQEITIPEPPNPLFEKLEITYAYSSKVNLAEGSLSGHGWDVTSYIRNTGSADATIDNVFINAKPFTAYNHAVVKHGGVYYPAAGTLAVAIEPGGNATVHLLILEGADVGITFSAGSTLDVKFHTASGKEYPKIVELV